MHFNVWRLHSFPIDGIVLFLSEVNMAIDIYDPVLVACVSTLLGYGSSYFAFKKLISDKYGKGRVHQNGLYYWFGFFSMVSIGQGLTTLVNEVFSASSNGADMREVVLARGIFIVVFLPAVLAIIAFVITKFRKRDVNQNIEIEPNVAVDNKSASTSNIDKSKNSSNVLVIVLLLIVGCFVFFNFVPLQLFKPVNEKSFTVNNCLNCVNGTCENRVGGFTGFKVTLNQVFGFYKNSDGQERISIYPNDDKMKCAILPERNFAFDCNLSDVGSGFVTQTIIVFNGSNMINHTISQKLIGASSPRMNITMQCEVN